MCRYHCEFSLSRCDEHQLAASPGPGSCTDLLSLELEAVMDQPAQAALPSSRREARAFNRDNLSRAVGDTWEHRLHFDWCVFTRASNEF